MKHGARHASVIRRPQPGRRAAVSAAHASDATIAQRCRLRRPRSTSTPLLDWYDAQRPRPAVARARTPAPWAVLVSEVMLQQTPVARVLPVYAAWLRALADAGRAGRRRRRRGGADVGQARLPAPGAAAARVRASRSPSATAARCPPTSTTCSPCPASATYTARAVAAFAFGQRRAGRRHQRAPGASPGPVDGQGDAGPPSTARDLAAVEALLPADPAARRGSASR